MKGDLMAGARIVEVVIAALALLLIAEVAGVPFTGYSVAIALAVGALAVTALHTRRR
jgi:hypothetical protein